MKIYCLLLPQLAKQVDWWVASTEQHSSQTCFTQLHLWQNSERVIYWGQNWCGKSTRLGVKSWFLVQTLPQTRCAPWAIHFISLGAHLLHCALRLCRRLWGSLAAPQDIGYIVSLEDGPILLSGCWLHPSFKSCFSVSWELTGEK